MSKTEFASGSFLNNKIISFYFLELFKRTILFLELFAQII